MRNPEMNVGVILLLRQAEKEQKKFFRFVLQQGLMSERLLLYDWNKDGDRKKVLSVLNKLSGQFHVYRVLVYDNVKETDDELKRLVTYLSGENTISFNDESILDFPVQILYVYGEEMGQSKTDWAGNTVRFLRIDGNSETAMQTGRSDLKKYCILLTLALGEIPFNFLESRTCYEVDLELDWEEVRDCAEQMEGKLNLLKSELEKAEEDWRRKRNMSKPFPEWQMERVILPDQGTEEQEEFQASFVRRRYKDQETILIANRQRLFSQMYYPKGELRTKWGEIEEKMEKMPPMGCLLNENGNAVLKRRKQEFLNRIAEKKGVQLELQEFEYIQDLKEKKVRRWAEQTIHTKEACDCFKWFALLELLTMLSIFFQGWGKELLTILSIFFRELGKVLLTMLSIFFQGWGKELPAGFSMAGAGKLYILPLAMAALPSLIFFAYVLCLMAMRWESWREYKNHSVKAIWSYKKEKRKYLEDSLSWILEYRRLCYLEEEQERLKAELEEEHHILEKHRLFQERIRAELHPLMTLTDAGNVSSGELWEKPNVDFSQEPNDQEYYKMPCKNGTGRVDINTSGRYIPAAFSFIHRLNLRKQV